MKEENNLICGRENDLIAFLYGELSGLESRTFQRHIQDCPACGNDLNALRGVRDSVVAWRDQSLGGATSREAMTAATERRTRRPQPSASAAVREFYNLSPFWMKGALAFVTVLFCLFASLAVAHWRVVPPASVATEVKSPAFSEQELNVLVERRVQEQLWRIKTGAEQAATQANVEEAPSQRNRASGINRGTQWANSAATQGARRPLSSLERAELASDLRLVSDGNEAELDLLDDEINR